MEACERNVKRAPARRAICIILTLLVMSSVGAGCRAADFAPPVQSTATSAPSFTIGLLLSSLYDPLYVSVQKGAIESASRLGAELIVREANNDAGRQVQQIDELLGLQVDALVLNPVDSAAVSPAVRRANELGVPIVTMERRVSGASNIAHVAPDNIAGGEMAATYLVEVLQGQGRVAELVGLPGTSAAQDRGSGFNRIMSAQPEMQIVARAVANFNRQQARRAFADILSEHSHLDAVFAHNDAMILGAIEAAEEVGRAENIIFVGFDATGEAITAIEAGQLAATVAQQPAEMGRLAVEMAIEQLRGQQIAQEITIDLALVAR